MQLQADILELADRIIPEQCVLECFIDPFTGIAIILILILMMIFVDDDIHFFLLLMMIFIFVIMIIVIIINITYTGQFITSEVAKVGNRRSLRVSVCGQVRTNI